MTYLQPRDRAHCHLNVPVDTAACNAVRPKARGTADPNPACWCKLLRHRRQADGVPGRRSRRRHVRLWTLGHLLHCLLPGQAGRYTPRTPFTVLQSCVQVHMLISSNQHTSMRALAWEFVQPHSGCAGFHRLHLSHETCMHVIHMASARPLEGRADTELAVTKVCHWLQVWTGACG